MAEVIKMRFLVRSRTAAEWAAMNEVLLMSTEGTGAREMGMEEDTGKYKLGDGVTPWNDLPYQGGGGKWGSIEGDLEDQEDLQGALDSKLEDVISGSGIAIDKTNARKPIISSTLGNIHVDDYVANYASLPTPPPTGKTTYYVQEDGLIYVWNDSAWPSNGDGITLTTMEVSTAIYKAGTIQIPSFATGLLRTQGKDGKYYLIPAFEIRPDSAYEAVVKADGPAVFYPLDDPLTGVARDISGNYVNASYKGGPTQVAQIVTGGASIGCTKLNGSSQYIDASVAAPALVNDYSIEMWFQCGPSGNFNDFLDVNQNATGGNIIYMSTTAVHWFAVPNTARGSVSLGTTLVANARHHVILTVKKSTNEFTAYVDGIMTDQKIITGTTWPGSTAQVLFGHDIYLGSHMAYTNGTMSCVAIYDKVLTSTQAAAHYAAGA